MIYFGTCAPYPGKVPTLSHPGVTRSMGDERFVYMHHESNGREIFSAYAAMMKEAIFGKAECLVLIHDDLEFRDVALAGKLRAAFSDPSVAVVGLIGACNAKGLRWWEGNRKGRVFDNAHGLHAFPYDDPEVHTLDGMMLALSPWALENLTLDDLGYTGFHGYDMELCSQARKVWGKRVIVADIEAFHHSRGGFTEGLADAEKVYQRRWFGR